MGVLYDSDPTDGTPPSDPDDLYSDTATYTFHVGPAAELEVSDGDAGRVPVGTRAFTIVAVNSGPDDAPAAQVTVTGLNAGDYVSHSATAGSFDSTTGVWTIGELRESGYHRNTYDREGEILTIITSAAVDTEITAAISNTQDYQVCIDSDGEDVDAASESACTATSGNTWHTTEYYDHISDNNSATIKAKEGTGADLPSLQSAQTVDMAIVVSWDPIDQVNGRRVTHYEVQRQASPWETVAPQVLRTIYVDIDVEAQGAYQYRVRAVNDWEQKGPWSQPIVARTGAPVMPGPPTGVWASPDGSTAIDVSWDAPLDDGGSPITSYEVQWSADGSSGWSEAGSTADGETLTFKHTGLSESATRYYRVAARNSNGLGPWSSAPHASAMAGNLPPVFSAFLPPISVAENTPRGTDIGAPVRATDADGDRVTHSLGGPDEAQFSIDDRSGQIRLRRALDYEIKDSYSVTVIATDGKGRAQASVTINVTDVEEPPGQVAQPTVTAISPTILEVAWTAPYNWGPWITHYDLEYQEIGATSWETVPALTSHSTIISELNPSTSYQFRVRAVNDEGEGQWSVPAQGQTPTPVAPGTVSNLVADTHPTYGVVRLTWDVPMSWPSHYEVRHCLGDGCDPATGAWARFSTDKTYVSDFPGSVGVNYIARGLTAKETYRFQVRQVNEAGTGGPVSDTVGAMAGSGNKATGPVKNLSATPGNGQITLSWDPIENSGRPVTSWAYRYCEGPECVLSPNLWYTIWNSDEATTKHTVTGLRNGTTYRFQVVPWNESESEFSDTVIVTLP